jgi:4-azaleucine resistance transporter AzlC
MRSIQRTLGPDLTRAIALVCLADALVGASYGAIAVGQGFPPWVPVLLSVVVFAGASQFMVIGILGAGGGLIAAVAAGLLVNVRHLPFGFAVGDALGSRLPRQLVGSHLMIDETVAFALAQRDPARRRAAYWTCGVALFVCWNLSVIVGALVGSAIDDTDALGLDAAFPAVLLALVLPSLRDAATRRAALVGAVIAVALAPFLPAGLPVLVALTGMLTLRLRTRRPSTLATSADASADANSGGSADADSDAGSDASSAAEATRATGPREGTDPRGMADPENTTAATEPEEGP